MCLKQINWFICCVSPFNLPELVVDLPQFWTRPIFILDHPNNERVSVGYMVSPSNPKKEHTKSKHLSLRLSINIYHMLYMFGQKITFTVCKLLEHHMFYSCWSHPKRMAQRRWKIMSCPRKFTLAPQRRSSSTAAP